MNEALAWIGLPAPSLIFAWTCFTRLDPYLRNEPKQALVYWLLGDKAWTKPWTSAPVALFDRLLAGKTSASPKYFVRPTLLRSLVATLIAIAAIALLLPMFGKVLCDPNHNPCNRSDFALTVLGGVGDYGWKYMSIFVLFNLAADYLSLCKTRLFMGIGARSASVSFAIFLPLFDLVVTFLGWNLLSDLALLTASTVVGGGEPIIGLGLPVDQMLGTYKLSLYFRTGDPFPVLLWSTFITIAWGLLFSLAAALTRALAALQRSVVWSQRFLNLDNAILETPMTVVGVIAAVVLLAAGGLIKLLPLI